MTRQCNTFVAKFGTVVYSHFKVKGFDDFSIPIIIPSKTEKKKRSYNYICEFSLVHQQMGCLVTVASVVDLNQRAAEYQVNLQSFSIRQGQKDLVF